MSNKTSRDWLTDLARDVMRKDYPLGAVESELRALGLDPEAIAARGAAAAARAPSGATVVRFPSWMRDGAVYHAAAAAAVHDPDRFEVAVNGDPHRVELRLEPIFAGPGDGLLQVSWRVSTFHPDGWELRFVSPEHELLACVFLGRDPEGTRTLGREDLGFDPVRTPVGYVFGSAGRSDG